MCTYVRIWCYDFFFSCNTRLKQLLLIGYPFSTYPGRCMATSLTTYSVSTIRPLSFFFCNTMTSPNSGYASIRCLASYADRMRLFPPLSPPGFSACVLRANLHANSTLSRVTGSTK